MNKNLDVSLVMEKSWSIFKNNWLRLSCMSLLMMAGYWFVNLLDPNTLPTKGTPEEILGWLIENWGSCCGWYLLSSFVLLCLAVLLYKEIFTVVKGEPVALSGGVFFRFVVVSVIVSIVDYVTFCFCIIPFIIVAPRLILADIYILDNPNMSVGEALERSWNITKGNTIKLIVLGIIAYIIGFIGYCCCCIGIIPAMALIYVMMVVIYQFLNDQTEGTADAEAKQEEVSFVVEEKTVVRD